MKTPNPSSNPRNPIEDDYSLYYSFLLQDPPSSTSDQMSPAKKRRKNDKKRSVAALLASVAALDSDDAADRRASAAAHRRYLSLLRSNLNLQSQSMLDYYSKIQDSDDEDSNIARRRRARLSLAAAAAAEGAETVGEPAGGARRLWVKDRSRDWWDRCCRPDFPELEFRKSFRMSKETFDEICGALESAVVKEDTTLRAAIPVRQRVAVCIYRLATGEPLRLVSKKFGLGISTCHKLVLEVCLAIRTVLMPKFLVWPDAASASDIKSRFKSLSGIPNIIGSIYTTHIPIIAPKISVAAYFNRRHTERNQKTSYSITVQGVIDPDGVFTDICIGWPGSMTDEEVLENSAIFQRATSGALSNSWIVGGAGYPLMDWLLVPYTHSNLTWTQHAFNEKIGEVQRMAKEAFGRLKGRWGCLRRRTEVKLQDLPVVLGACCVLHNVCEMRKEVVEEEFEVVDDEMVAEKGMRSAGAMQVRDSIAHNLLHHGLAGTKFS